MNEAKKEKLTTIKMRFLRTERMNAMFKYIADTTNALPTFEVTDNHKIKLDWFESKMKSIANAVQTYKREYSKIDYVTFIDMKLAELRLLFNDFNCYIEQQFKGV